MEAQGADGSDRPNDPFQRLVDEQAKWTESSLDRNKATARSHSESHVQAAQLWLNSRMDTLRADINTLEGQLGGASGKLMPMQVVDERGVTITDDELKADPGKDTPCTFPLLLSLWRNRWIPPTNTNTQLWWACQCPRWQMNGPGYAHPPQALFDYEPKADL